MKWTLLFLMLLGEGEPPPSSPATYLYGHVQVENLPPYGHPGTPLSVVRIVDPATGEDVARDIASVVRLSLRPSAGFDAAPGFGPCATFQGKVQELGPDIAFGHLCFVMNDLGGFRVDLWLRDSQGQYRVVQSWDADVASLTRKMR